MAVVLAAGAAFLEVYGLGQGLFKIYTEAKDFIEKASRNPGLARQLAGIYKCLYEELAPLADICRSNNFKLSDSNIAVFRTRVAELKETLQGTQTLLEQKIEELKSRFQRVIHAASTDEWLSQLAADAERASRLVLDITSHFVT